MIRHVTDRKPPDRTSDRRESSDWHTTTRNRVLLVPTVHRCVGIVSSGGCNRNGDAKWCLRQRSTPDVHCQCYSRDSFVSPTYHHYVFFWHQRYQNDCSLNEWAIWPIWAIVLVWDPNVAIVRDAEQPARPGNGPTPHVRRRAWFGCECSRRWWSTRRWRSRELRSWLMNTHVSTNSALASRVLNPFPSLSTAPLSQGRMDDKWTTERMRTSSKGCAGSMPLVCNMFGILM